MGLVMGITGSVLAIAAGLASLMVWTALLFPRPTALSGSVLERRPMRCFLVGAVVTLLWGGPALALIHSPHGGTKLAGWVLLLPLVAILVVGLTAMSQLLGERLRELSPTVTPLGGLVRGAVTLELAMLPPFLGWFVFAPLVGVTVIGAGTMGCFARGRGSVLRYGDTERRSGLDRDRMSPVVLSDQRDPTPVGCQIPIVSPCESAETSVRGHHAQPA